MGLVVGVMVMAAGLSYRYVVGLLALTIPLGYLVLISAPYRIRRLTAFWCPECDPLGDGFHLLQSLIAVGSGGLLGRGLMGGVQKLFYLPEPYNDFIYAVIAEELGLLGASLVLVCFCVIAWRGLRASVTAPDRFGAFLALGITTMVVAQALLNISVVLGLAPTKGIPLPLVSSGGSSLLVNLASIGVLLNISQHAVSESSAVEPGAA
jgi:cell division protein FtsW